MKQGKNTSRSDVKSNWFRLLVPDVLGFYKRCEVTEILGFDSRNPNQPFNVFSVLVLEEADPVSVKKPINKKRIQISGLKNLSFGVWQYHINLKSLENTIEKYANNGRWAIEDSEISFGDLHALPSYFVPPDGTECVPINRLLKNNFWNGSYVMELFDNSKLSISPLLKNPLQLQALSEIIQGYVPIKIASLSDRLGNILIQAPIKTVMCKFGFGHESRILANIEWHPSATQRPCRLTTQSDHDGIILEYAGSSVTTSKASLDTADQGQLSRNILWDDKNACILAASSATSPIREINIGMQSGGPDPVRTIVIPSIAQPNEVNSISISNSNSVMKSRIGDASAFDYAQWTGHRIYEEEQRSLREKREFLQYGIKKRGKTGHISAIEDIRYLINQHGKFGVWLWDPYLNSIDIMKTLFFCKHYDSDLRALSDFKCVKKLLKNSISFEQWSIEQSSNFLLNGNNHIGLKLQFRARHGQKGWPFHDRFLIFPQEDLSRPPLVWSLGTSVNSAGKAHHILQKVGNARFIYDAFLDLWEAVNTPNNIVWSYP